MRAPHCWRGTRPATVTTCGRRAPGCSAISIRARSTPRTRRRSSSSSARCRSASRCPPFRRAWTPCAATSRGASAARAERLAMRSLLWLLAVFAAAVALVIVGRVDAGYVLFVYPPWRVEVTMIFFAIAALAAFMLLYGFARLMGQVLSLPASVRAYRARRRRERAHAALARALQAYYEGRYRRAEREASLAYETGTVPGIAALLAARAAHQLRDFASRDRWFERADGAGDAW